MYPPGEPLTQFGRLPGGFFFTPTPCVSGPLTFWLGSPVHLHILPAPAPAPWVAVGAAASHSTPGRRGRDDVSATSASAGRGPGAPVSGRAAGLTFAPGPGPLAFFAFRERAAEAGERPRWKPDLRLLLPLPTTPPGHCDLTTKKTVFWRHFHFLLQSNKFQYGDLEFLKGHSLNPGR